MSEPYIGQIMTAAFAFAPRQWATCDGQTMAVQQNQALFALLGVMYGGNGSTTFMLPDLRGRVPVGGFGSVDASWQPAVYTQGSPLGSETVTLTTAQIPSHTHALSATSTAASDGSPSAGQIFAAASAPIYGSPDALVGLAAGPLSSSGNAPHSNVQPFQVINMCIALNGIWPSRG